MSKTTAEQIRRAVQVDEENRFDLAGRILAASELVADEGEDRSDSLLLHHLAVIVSREGPEYARGWLEGAHHIGGVRIHNAWLQGLGILDRRPGESCGICGGPREDHGALNGYPDKHRFDD